MPRPLPVDYLQPGESILRQEGRHGLSVVDELIGATLLAALPITAVLVVTLGYFPQWVLPLAVPVCIVVGLFLIGFFIGRFWRVTTSQYTITDERVYTAWGRLRFQISQTTYDKLTDIHVRQGIFGRIYGFGTLRLETAGTGIVLHGVRAPFDVKQTVEDARAAFIRSLVGDVAPKPTFQAADAAPRPLQAQDTVWSSRPAFASFIGNIVGLAVVAVFLAVGGFGALLAAGPTNGLSFILPAVILLVLGLSAFGTFVRYRYTFFEIGTRGVVVTRGLLTRQRVETTYTKVTDVTVYQGLLGRILDYGNITVNTAGSNNAPVVFQGVPRPEQVKQLIDAQRNA